MLYTPSDYNKILKGASQTVGYNGDEKLLESGDLKNWSAPLLKQPYIFNQFWVNLCDQFIYESSRQNYFTSAFDLFRTKRDTVGRGTYETVTNPVFPLAYDMTAFDRLLQYYPPDVKTQYFMINVRDTYPLSINYMVARDALTSYENLDNIMQSLIIAPRNGHTIIENNMIKELLNVNIANSSIKSRPYTKPTTEQGWRELAKDIRAIALEMAAEPSTKYNNYENIEGSDGKVWAQSDRSDLVFIGTADVISAINTYVLNSFNEDFVDFKFNFVVLSDTGYQEYNRDTRAWGTTHEGNFDFIICDGGFIKLEDNFEASLTDTNIFTVGLQMNTTIEQTIDFRVFRNAIAFTSANAVLEDITLSSNSVQLTSDDEQAEITITTTPTDYTADFVTATKGIVATLTNGTTSEVLTAEQTAQLVTDLITVNVANKTMSIEGDYNTAKVASVKEYLTDEGYTVGASANLMLSFETTLTDKNSGRKSIVGGVGNWIFPNA